MNRMTTPLFLVALLVPALKSTAEDLSNVRVGAKYYLKGVLSETEVRVLAVDSRRAKVQIHNTETDFIEWVSPAEIITPRESTKRNTERIVVGAALLKGVFDYATEPPPAQPKRTTARKPASVQPAAPTHSKKNLSPAEVFLMELKKEEQVEKENDLAAKSPKLKPRGTVGKIFEPDELDVYVNKVTFRAYIFHGKKIDYNQISHIEYSTDEHWVVVVYKNGKKYDLGVHIQWLVRPYWRRAKTVNWCRTKNQEKVEDCDVRIIHRQGRERASGYKIGSVLLPIINDGKYEGDRVDFVLPGSPSQLAGLKTGDTILSANNSTLEAAGDLTTAIRLSGGSTITLDVIRDRKPVQLAVTPTTAE